jgi:hypothetical protein
MLPSYSDTVRGIGLALLPLLLLSAGLSAGGTLSLRYTVLFFCSLSFQTALIGWLALLTRNSVLGWISVRWQYFVMAVWFLLLRDKEAGYAEWTFNVLLHYVMTLLVFLHWNSNRGPPPSERLYMLSWLYPSAYLAFQFLLDARLGWEMYPVKSEHPFMLAGAFVLIEVGFFMEHVQEWTKAEEEAEKQKAKSE